MVNFTKILNLDNSKSNHFSERGFFRNSIEPQARAPSPFQLNISSNNDINAKTLSKFDHLPKLENKQSCFEQSAFNREKIKLKFNLQREKEKLKRYQL